jgi:hypothetical protein
MDPNKLYITFKYTCDTTKSLFVNFYLNATENEDASADNK